MGAASKHRGGEGEEADLAEHMAALGSPPAPRGRWRGCDATAVAISSVGGEEIGAPRVRSEEEERDRVYIWREAAVGKNSTGATRRGEASEEVEGEGPRKR
jgi:hypothetical protein